MRRLPEIASDYLKKNHLSPMNTAIIELNSLGIVEDAFGAFEIFNTIPPEKGMASVDRFPFLEGLLSRREEEIQIRDVNIAHTKRADVAIIPEKKKCYVIFTPAQTPKSFDEEVQNHNTSILKDFKQQSLGSARLLADVLFSMGFMAWTPEGSAFRLKTYHAEWFQELFPEMSSLTYFEDISALFPYLDSFLPEAQKVWDGEADEVSTSDLWTEFRGSDEVYLQAHAITQNGREFLLIGTQNTSTTEQHELIQKAREKSLHNEQLEKAEARLRNLLNFKNQFVSIVSHDLRSPLAGVVNGMELIIDDDAFGKGMSEDGKLLLQEMYDELVKVLDYNQKLYHWSNLELGRFNLEKNAVKASHFKKSLLKRFEKHLADKGLTLDFHIAEDFTFEADESLFTQAINNLVQNAIKFSPKGETISVNISKKSGMGIFEVKDHGVGIPEKYQDDLFNNLKLHHSQGTAGEKGTGLGLSITKNIIEAHEMQIRFKSKENQGTSFFIDIPL